jgi:type IV pilus assembly protein PilA
MKKNQKGFTLVELLAVIVILAVIILIAVNAVLPQMQKARKKSFADEGLSFAKAAETAYVDRQESGPKAFTVSDLKAHYVTKSDTNYKGCIVVTADAEGNITGKTIYLASNKWMIVGDTADTLGNNLDKDVKAYSTTTETNPWATAYDTCTQSGAPDVSEAPSN